MSQKFSINLLLLIGLNLLIKPVYLFGIEVGIQNAVGTSEYGLYYAMFNFTFLFNVILDMGINNFQKVSVAKNSREGIANMSSLFPLKLLLGGFYMVITVVAAWLTGFEGRYWFFIGWLMLNHLLSAYLLLLRANLGGLKLFIRDSILSVADRLILVIALGYLLWFGNEPFRIEWLVQFQTLAYAIAIAVALVMLPAGDRFPRPHFSWSGMTHMLRQTGPYAVLILLMTVYNKVDGVMLERLARNGLEEAGIYAQAYRILDAGNNFAFLYAGLLLPLFAHALAQRDRSTISNLCEQGARLLIVPTALAFVICLFYSEWIMNLLYDHEADRSARALPWLMGSFVFLSSGYVFGTLITATERMRLMNYSALLAVVINVVLNFILIPQLGALGAAISSCISLGAMAVFQIAILYRQSIAPSWEWLPSAMAVLVAALLVGSAIRQLHMAESWGLATLGLCCAFLFTFFTLKRSDLSEILERKDNKSEGFR